jgi:hypothetical protein
MHFTTPTSIDASTPNKILCIIRSVNVNYTAGNLDGFALRGLLRLDSDWSVYIGTWIEHCC